MMMKKKTKTSDNVDSGPKDVDFSFEGEAEKAVDEMFEKTKNSSEKKPEIPHLSEKIQLGMEMRHIPPDKGFLNVRADVANVTFTDKYGEKQVVKKVIITSKDIEGVEHVEITDGIFEIDLRNDSNFWHIRSPVTVPSLINQAVRVAVDIKECYKVVKRKLELPWILIFALIGGVAIIVLMMISLMS